MIQNYLKKIQNHLFLYKNYQCGVRRVTYCDRKVAVLAVRTAGTTRQMEDST